MAAALDRSTLVCTGVGMTGPPHFGTVGQILTAVELQEAGLDVQFVLADLEPYHGGADWERVRGLAERYRTFALDLGFDPDRGALRAQSESRDVMHTAERLAPYYGPEEWPDGPGHEPTDWERAVERAYERGDSGRGETESETGGETESETDGEGDGRRDWLDDGSTSAAADAHSAVLHGADFLHPLFAGEYDQVVIALGVDEHGLTPWTRRFRDAAPVSGPVAGLHTRLVPGLAGAPKMSKSIDAGLSLDAGPDAVRDQVLGSADAGDPDSSPTFQAMCLASRYDSNRLDRLASACVAGDEAWRDAKREYADSVADLAARWRATGE
ncbi:MAG: hypothetical protein ABEJ40_10535 [Haloarculaceae archaeon]